MTKFEDGLRAARRAMFELEVVVDGYAPMIGRARAEEYMQKFYELRKKLIDHADMLRAEINAAAPSVSDTGELK